jgi:hypothetical protein
MGAVKKNTLSVEIIGFSPTELRALASALDLSAQRIPNFVRHAADGTAPDILLVDADNPEALRLMIERDGSGSIPTVMVGESNHGTRFRVLSRPIRWMKLFRFLEDAMAEPSNGACCGGDATGMKRPSLIAPK